MKIFVVTDLEGVGGVNGKPDTIGNQIVNFDASARLLTREVNAMAEGLANAGATEIVVWDGHGGSKSILIEELSPLVKLLQTGGSLTPMTYLDSTYAAAVQLGAHAMMGVPDGFLNHTFNSHAVNHMWLNGEAIGEIGIEGFCFSYFGVPTILVTGDTAACREAQGFFGKVETVETKRAVGRYAVINEPLENVREAVRKAAKKALRNLKSFAVKKPRGPFELKVQLMCPNMADGCQMRGAKRLDAHTVLFTSDDFLDVWAQRNGWAPGVYHQVFKTRKG